MTGATVTADVLDDVALVRVEGEIDFGNAADVAEQIQGAVPNGALGLILDATGLRYVDSAGIRMLFQVFRSLQAARQGVRLVLREDAPVRRLVEVTDLRSAAPLSSSVDEALEGIRSSAEDRL